jgi:hypothetical protein
MMVKMMGKTKRIGGELKGPRHRHAWRHSLSRPTDFIGELRREFVNASVTGRIETGGGSEEVAMTVHH